MSSPGITTASLSDVGRVRTRNEDHCDEFVSQAGYRLLVVADGMGGHRAGGIASRVTVETIGEIFQSCVDQPESMLRLALEEANRRVFELACEDPELRGMGTTAVVLLLGPDFAAWVAHVGDSRLYRLRAESLEPLTRDHSVVAELERRGLLTAAEAASHPRRNEILRSVGVQAEIEVEIASIEAQPGDRFLLCSDGLSGMLDDAEIAAIAGANAPGEAVRLLIECANAYGGHDNVTVQIASIDSPEAASDQPATAPAATDDAGAEAPARSERRSRPGVQRKLVVVAVVLAGLAALVLLWRIYAISTTGQVVPAATAGVETEAGAE